jgi:hypothetical protein
LEALIRKTEKLAANEVINAFNTGRSFASHHSSGKGKDAPTTPGTFNLNARIVDGPVNLR